jgi:hypothetical protein
MDCSSANEPGTGLAKTAGSSARGAGAGFGIGYLAAARVGRDRIKRPAVKKRETDCRLQAGGFVDAGIEAITGPGSEEIRNKVFRIT